MRRIGLTIGLVMGVALALNAMGADVRDALRIDQTTGLPSIYGHPGVVLSAADADGLTPAP